MSDPRGLGRGLPRLLRGLALALGCLGLPLAGHALVDGSLPDSPTALAVALLLTGMCVALADRRRGAAEIAVVVALSQPVLHVLFVLAGHGGPLWRGGWAMVLAHAIAAAVVVVLLAGAERVLWALEDLGRRVLGPYDLVGPAPLQATAGAPRLRTREATAVSLLHHVVVRRGPPGTPA